MLPSQVLAPVLASCVTGHLLTSLNQHGHHGPLCSSSLLEAACEAPLTGWWEEGAVTGEEPGQSFRPTQGLSAEPFTNVLKTFQYFKGQFSPTGAYQLNTIIMPDPCQI